jgi:hypothetical protein
VVKFHYSWWARLKLQNDLGCVKEIDHQWLIIIKQMQGLTRR